MKTKTLAQIGLASIAGFAILTGCDKQPDVVVSPEPSSTTIIHDKTPAATPAPNVVVTPPASDTHTETHTNTTTTPDSTTPTTSSSSTTTTG